jgi:hypothetical protein
MRAFGVLLIVCALIATGLGFFFTAPQHWPTNSFEALADQIRSRSGSIPANFEKDYEDAKSARIQNMYISFGVGAVLFVSGIICAAAPKTHSSVPLPPYLREMEKREVTRNDSVGG